MYNLQEIISLVYLTTRKNLCSLKYCHILNSKNSHILIHQLWLKKDQFVKDYPNSSLLVQLFHAIHLEMMSQLQCHHAHSNENKIVKFIIDVKVLVLNLIGIIN